MNDLASTTADSWFVYRLMGFNLRNEDGSRRQRYIRRCKPLDRLQLVSAPTLSDLKAIGVADAKGRQLGYLDRRCASQVRTAIKNGNRFDVLVAAQWRDPQGDCCLVVAILQLKPGNPDEDQSKAYAASAFSVRATRRILGMFLDTVNGLAKRRTAESLSEVLTTR
ncbi:MAG: hypothetical protein NVSMB62_04560 [Acidobacteriaceae bacterium]